MSITAYRVNLLALRKRSFAEKIAPRLQKKYLGKRLSVEINNFLFDILKELNIKYFIECGANEAEASQYLANRGVKSLAIEANPFTFDRCTNLKLDNYESKNIGLGASNGVSKFFIPKVNQTAGNATFSPSEGKEYDTIEVVVEPLDTVAQKFVKQGENFALWIDVEGFQHSVLSGAVTTLASKHCIAVKIEMENEPFFENQILSEEINSVFIENQFTPVYCDFEYDTQFNVLYVKTEIMDEIYKIYVQYLYQFTKKLSWTILLDKEVLLISGKMAVKTIFGKNLGNRIASLLGSKSATFELKEK